MKDGTICLSRFERLLRKLFDAIDLMLFIVFMCGFNSFTNRSKRGPCRASRLASPGAVHLPRFPEVFQCVVFKAVEEEVIRIILIASSLSFILVVKLTEVFTFRCLLNAVLNFHDGLGV